MKLSAYLIFIIAVTISLPACSSHKTHVRSSSMESIEMLDASLDSTGAQSPTIEQYQEARGEFLGNMTGLLDQYEKESGSNAGKTKNIISISGLAVGLGGTIASFIVDNEDDKATISQTSGIVAAVSGIIGLLPIGSGTKGAASVQKYLELEIPRFEKRWPADPGEPLTPAEWDSFVLDCRQMQSVVDKLRE